MKRLLKKIVLWALSDTAEEIRQEQYENNDDIETSVSIQPKTSIKKALMKEIRVITGREFHKPVGAFVSWNVTYIEKPEHLEKLYQHLVTSSRVYYRVSGEYITAYFDTKKWGLVYCGWQGNGMFFEFGIYQTGTRYDVNYAIGNNVHPQLTEFISDLSRRWRNEYNQDKNL